jgi:hypothetical protein
VPERSSRASTNRSNAGSIGARTAERRIRRAPQVPAPSTVTSSVSATRISSAGRPVAVTLLQGRLRLPAKRAPHPADPPVVGQADAGTGSGVLGQLTQHVGQQRQRPAGSGVLHQVLDQCGGEPQPADPGRLLDDRPQVGRVQRGQREVAGPQGPGGLAGQKFADELRADRGRGRWTRSAS